MGISVKKSTKMSKKRHLRTFKICEANIFTQEKRKKRVFHHYLSSRKAAWVCETGGKSNDVF
ncbi:hypothetical protein D5281_07125 [bacterium 1xD42-62]|uniref:Uncharacterized protein n=1 Tax=Parablautia muri TaxID=2320879 RepID=A0A9X5BEQ0_9FIRM|nr:hypothetical protein [Parablautia muri]